MVRYRRNFVAGGTYFFTLALADRRSKLLTENIDALRNSIRRAQTMRPFDIDAIVVLPEHFHAVLTLPIDDVDYSGRWRLIKALFSNNLIQSGVALQRHPNGELKLWQRRFWEHTIRDTADFQRHIDYVHFNPVKHMLVGRVGDWPYSTFHRYVRDGSLADDWGGEFQHSNTDKFGEP